MKTFKEKVAVITGAGSGMGRYLAVLLAKDGADVCICDVNKETLDETAEMIRKYNSISVNKKVTPELKYFSILFKNFFQKYGSLLGLFQESKKEFLNGLNLLLLKSKKIKITEIEKKIEDRNNARKLKDYNISDKIRDELLVLGIEIKDNKDGKTSWSVKV